jgi:hypothetical protein
VCARLASRLGPITLGICAAAAGCGGSSKAGGPADSAAAVDGSPDTDAALPPENGSDDGSDDGSDVGSDDGDSDAGPVDSAVDQPAGVACPPPLATVCPDPPPSFAATIVPILDASCNTCHDPNVPGAPWPLHDYGDVLAWRGVIIPVLLDCSMPPEDSGVSISEVDRQQILTWLACDAPDN